MSAGGAFSRRRTGLKSASRMLLQVARGRKLTGSSTWCSVAPWVGRVLMSRSAGVGPSAGLASSDGASWRRQLGDGGEDGAPVVEERDDVAHGELLPARTDRPPAGQGGARSVRMAGSNPDGGLDTGQALAPARASGGAGGGVPGLGARRAGVHRRDADVRDDTDPGGSPDGVACRGGRVTVSGESRTWWVPCCRWPGWHGLRRMLCSRTRHPPRETWGGGVPFEQRRHVGGLDGAELRHQRERGRRGSARGRQHRRGRASRQACGRGRVRLHARHPRMRSAGSRQSSAGSRWGSVPPGRARVPGRTAVGCSVMESSARRRARSPGGRLCRYRPPLQQIGADAPSAPGRGRIRRGPVPADARPRTPRSWLRSSATAVSLARVRRTVGDGPGARSLLHRAGWHPRDRGRHRADGVKGPGPSRTPSGSDSSGEHFRAAARSELVGVVGDARIHGLDVDRGLVAYLPYWELAPQSVTVVARG